MDIDQVLKILETREKVAKQNGNTTEASFIYEVFKIVNDYKQKNLEELENKNILDKPI